ncbi:DUF11 domain-containing protein, partial [Patescibacteria group bacterium]|nr:DUF11 domain-containing protein [Patescibacteria group bacterium]
FFITTMKKIINGLFLFSVLCFLSSVFTPKAFADSYGSYGGGGAPTDLTINKVVKNPISNVYVENLGSTDPTFSPGATVSFQLVIKNGSGETMNPVTVVDQLPDYLSFVSATVPSSTNKGGNSVTFTLDNMIAGETRTIEVSVKVAEKSSFPVNRSMFCVSNYSKVTAPARPNGDDDTAELCITTGPGNLPVAGVNDVFGLIPFLSLGGVGTFLLSRKQK